MRESDDPRLARLRKAVEAADGVVAEGRDKGWGGKGDELWEKARKRDVLALCRSRFPDPALPWVDAAVALGQDSDPVYSRLLGTGGNLGRQDFSATYLARMEVVLRDRRGAGWLRSVLTGDESVPYLRDSVGQFDHGRAGGIQSSPLEKADDKGFVNPWAFLLTVEGALLFATVVVRRHGVEYGAEYGRAALPFQVRGSTAGYASAAPDESPLGELWAPEWSAPTRLPGIVHLLGEGRAQWRAGPARSGLDFARAVATLGVDRGITAFERHVFVDRLGQNPLAVPAGRIEVKRRRSRMTSRLSFDVELAPVLGSTFQPTGFPDVGAATFTRFEGDDEVAALLVESVQSMANRLEATAWDGAADHPVDAVAGLPWVRVVRAGTAEFLTSSRLEAHRLASPFVHAAKLDGNPMFDVIRDRLALAKDTPLNCRLMARAVAGLDPFCLVHGVFFSQQEWWGQPRFERAVSGVIEAHHVQRAVSGGRKSDRVRHQLGEEGGGTAEGYGSVPFHRTEWTAKRITASFVLDVELLRSYGLPQPVTELLETLALWEIRTLLDGALRLRAACDLEVIGEVTSRHGSHLPEAHELTARLGELIPAGREVFGDGEPLTVEWSGKKG